MTVNSLVTVSCDVASNATIKGYKAEKKITASIQSRIY